MNPMDNTHQLKKFIEVNKLMYNNNVVNFIGIITINTKYNKISKKEIPIMINFNGFDNNGVLEVFDDDIVPEIFPSKFNAKYDSFENINDIYLKITGFHKINPNISNYEVTIVPIK